jgi:hypothetical protein
MDVRDGPGDCWLVAIGLVRPVLAQERMRSSVRYGLRVLLGASAAEALGTQRSESSTLKGLAARTETRPCSAAE